MFQVENYLYNSEYERHHLDMISEDDSFNSSQVCWHDNQWLELLINN